MTEQQPLDHRAPSAPDQLRLPVGRAEEEVGVQLKQQRLKRRIELAEAGRALNLSVSSLDKIERGELDHLAPLYRRGYVKNYARYLGLEVEPLLELLGAPDQAVLQAVMPHSKAPIKFDRILKYSTYLIVTTLIVPPLVLIYIQGGLRFFDPEPSSSSTSPMVESVAEASEQRVSDRMARALALEDIGAAGDETGSDSDPAQTQAPMTATALPVGAIRPLRDPTLARNDGDGPVSADEAAAQDSPGAILSLEMIDDSWLEIYAANGDRLEYDLLRRGDRREFVAEPPFRLLLGRASAVSLLLDGAPVEFEGQDRADVASFELLADGEVRR